MIFKGNRMTYASTQAVDLFRFAEPVQHAPYPHVLQDSLLPDEVYRDLVRTMPATDEFGKAFRMHGDLTYGDPGYMKLIQNVEAWKTLHEAVHCEDFVRLTIEKFREEIQREIVSGQLDLDLNNYSYTGFMEGRQITKTVSARHKASKKNKNSELYTRLDIGYGLEGYGVRGGGGGVHIDNASRLFSMLIYFNKQSDFEGGGFNFHVIRDKKPETVKTVQLKENRSLISLQNNTAFHSVSEIKKCKKPRFAVYIAVASRNRLWTRIRNRNAAIYSQNRDFSEGRFKLSLLKRGVKKVRRILRRS